MAKSPFPFVRVAAGLGAPLFAATLAACLLSWRFDLVHAILLGISIVLLYLQGRINSD